MDDYGYITKDDAEMVAAAIDESAVVTFSFSHGNGTANQIWMARQPTVISKLQHVHADGGFVVGVYMVGTYIFRPKADSHGYFAGYVADKLGLSLTDAEPLAALIVGVSEHLTNGMDREHSVVANLGNDLSTIHFELIHAHAEIERLTKENAALKEDTDD